MTMLEDRLREAMHAEADTVEPSPDLFARLSSSLEDEQARRRWRRRISTRAALLLIPFVALVAAVTDYREGALHMDWWVLELITTAILLGVALFLGPFIKRFGKSYAADVFRANPGTGKSYIVLTDFAYYLIFLSYTLFTVSFESGGSWAETVNADQLKDEVSRVAGIILIIGLLHSLNIVALPVMGRLLSLNRRLDDDDPGDPGEPGGRRRQRGRGAAGVSMPSDAAWVLRIEPAGPQTSVDG